MMRILKKKKESAPSSSLKAPWDSSTPPTLAQSLSAYAEPQKAQVSGTSNGTTKPPKTTKPAVEETKYAEGTMAWNLSKLKTSPYYQEMNTRANNFIAAGKVSDKNYQEAKQEVEDEFNTTGIWNNVKSIASKAENIIRTSLLSPIGGPMINVAAGVAITKHPFDKEKKRSKKRIIIRARKS